MGAPEEHALLSASGAHRWIRCTPSARLEEKTPETPSEYAEEGTLAHKIGELKLRKAFVEPMGTRKFNNQLKKLQGNPLYQPEMLKFTDMYVDYVFESVHAYETAPFVAAEKKLSYSDYAPEGFGTGDCIIIGGNVLHIIDLKYGKGISVKAYDNPQMELYALGALIEYSFLYNIETIKMTIVQPRLDSISEAQLTVKELLDWGEWLKPIAQVAFKGEGEYVPGDHCQFCRASALCRARADFNTSLEDYHYMKPPLISNDEVGLILEKAQNLAKWAKNLEEYALGASLRGEIIPGWKVVPGRSIRQFTDQEVAFKVLTENGIADAMLYERKPLTLAATETLVGKKQFNELLSSFVDRPPGKPTLVPENDGREPIKRMTAEEAFEVAVGPMFNGPRIQTPDEMTEDDIPF